MSKKAASPKPKIRIGIQPTGWTNDDFPEIGNDTPYELILDQTASTDFEGGSTGHNYPTHLPSLKYALKEKNLSITSTWVGTKFTAENQYDATIDIVKAQIAFLTSVGSTDIVVAELAAAVNQVRTKSVLDDRPIFNEAQWYLLATGLDEAGRLARESGMRLCYHHHVGTGVMIRSEIDKLMETTDPEFVSMCIDTGHAYFAGVDPIVLAADYIDRIKHVHLKSVRARVMEKAVPGKYSFYQAIMEGIFTVPGDPEGCIDFKPIFETFRKHRYEGWIVVEAEQDPVKANPLKYAKMSREFIKSQFGH